MNTEPQIAKALQNAVDCVCEALGRWASDPKLIRPRADGARMMIERAIEGLYGSTPHAVDLTPIDGAIGEAQHRSGMGISCRSPLVKEALKQVRDWRVELVDRGILPEWAAVFRLEEDLMRMERNLSDTVFPVYMMTRMEIRALKYLMHARKKV